MRKTLVTFGLWAAVASHRPHDIACFPRRVFADPTVAKAMVLNRGLGNQERSHPDTEDEIVRPERLNDTRHVQTSARIYQLVGALPLRDGRLGDLSVLAEWPPPQHGNDELRPIEAVASGRRQPLPDSGSSKAADWGICAEFDNDNVVAGGIVACAF